MYTISVNINGKEQISAPVGEKELLNDLPAFLHMFSKITINKV